MPSIMTLEGPKLGCGPCQQKLGDVAPTQEQCMAQVRKESLIVAGIVAVIGGALWWFGSRSRRGALRGPEMLKIIASEARTPEEFARRAEAWNAAERSPLPVTKLAKAYRKAKPATVARLIRDAREQREEGRERLWTRMSKGLRDFGVTVTEKQQRMFKRGVEAMRRAMKGTPDVDRAFNVAIRGSKDPDFAAGVRNAWNRVSPKGNREAADKALATYGFKAG